MFKRLRLIKWSPILFEVFGDATGTAGEVLLMGEKRVVEKVDRGILAGFLAKEC